MSEDLKENVDTAEAEVQPEMVEPIPEAVVQKQSRQPDSAAISFVYKFILLIVGFVAIAALGTSYILWEEIDQLGKNSDSISAEIKNQVKQQTDLIAAEQSKQFAQVDNALEKSREDSQQFLDLLQSMRVQLERQAKSDIKLIQAESVLRLAKNQYEILHDRETTMVALTLAAKLLEDFSQAQVAVIRNLVLTEIQSVQNMDVPNLSAELIKLELLINNSNQLQLITAIAEEMVESDKQARKEGSKKTWTETFKGLLKSLQPLVTIRRHQGATVAMLSVEEEKLVRAILKSRYEYIRQAILQKDPVLLKSSVDAAQDWVKRYFDPEKVPVKNTLEQLDEIGSMKLQAEYPPIGYALEQLVKFRMQENTQVTP